MRSRTFLSGLLLLILLVLISCEQNEDKDPARGELLEVTALLDYSAATISQYASSAGMPAGLEPVASLAPAHRELSST